MTGNYLSAFGMAQADRSIAIISLLQGYCLPKIVSCLLLIKYEFFTLGWDRFRFKNLHFHISLICPFNNFHHKSRATYFNIESDVKVRKLIG